MSFNLGVPVSVGVIRTKRSRRESTRSLPGTSVSVWWCRPCLSLLPLLTVWLPSGPAAALGFPEEGGATRGVLEEAGAALAFPEAAGAFSQSILPQLSWLYVVQPAFHP